MRMTTTRDKEILDILHKYHGRVLKGGCYNPLEDDRVLEHLIYFPTVVNDVDKVSYRNNRLSIALLTKEGGDVYIIMRHDGNDSYHWHLYIDNELSNSGVLPIDDGSTYAVVILMARELWSKWIHLTCMDYKWSLEEGLANRYTYRDGDFNYYIDIGIDNRGIYTINGEAEYHPLGDPYDHINMHLASIEVRGCIYGIDTSHINPLKVAAIDLEGRARDTFCIFRTYLNTVSTDATRTAGLTRTVEALARRDISAS